MNGSGLGMTVSMIDYKTLQFPVYIFVIQVSIQEWN